MTNHKKNFHHYLSDFDENWCMALSYDQNPPVKILDFYNQKFLSYRRVKFWGKQKTPFKKCIYLPQDTSKI